MQEREDDKRPGLSLRWRRWGQFLAAALLLHAALIGTALWSNLPGLLSGQAQNRSMQVDLVVLPHQQVEAAKPKPAHAPYKATSLPAPPAQAEAVLHMSSTPQAAVEAPSPAPVASALPAAADPSAGFEGLPGANTSPPAVSDSRDSWQSQVLSKLAQSKRYPEAALRQEQQDRIAMHIRLDRQGKVLDQGLVSSQGYPALDEEALALIARAAPLPPPPPEVPDADLDFTVVIDFHLSPKATRTW